MSGVSAVGSVEVVSLGGRKVRLFGGLATTFVGDDFVRSMFSNYEVL